MKVLADQQIPFARQAFQPFGEVELVDGRSINNRLLQHVDLLLVRSITRVNAELLDNTPVQFVGTATSGFDHIDQDFLLNQGIAYAYAPGSNARSVAEYVLSALFAVFEHELKRLQDARVGIIGYGHVGSTLASMLQTLGIDYLLNDPPLANSQRPEPFISLDELLQQSDIVTLHVPLTRHGPFKTENLIGERELQLLRESSLLINTARGGVIDEQALLNVMSDKSLSTVIDVWQNEPAIDHRLLAQADIATAHIAGYSIDGKLRATDMLYRSACQVFQQSACWNAELELATATQPVDLGDRPLQPMQVVQSLIHSQYAVRHDHRLLLESLKMPESERAGYFHRLRREYSARYEFNHCSYRLSDQQRAAQPVLQGLGFVEGDQACA